MRGVLILKEFQISDIDRIIRCAHNAHASLRSFLASLRLAAKSEPDEIPLRFISSYLEFVLGWSFDKDISYICKLNSGVV